MMKITREEVEYVAHLARIELTAEEAEKFTGQLGQMLEYFQKLEKLDTKNVEPTRHAVAASGAFRDDQARPGYDAPTALQNAPDKEGAFFRVPKIIE